MQRILICLACLIVAGCKPGVKGRERVEPAGERPAPGATSAAHPDSLEFVMAYRAAHEAQDVSAALRLFHLDGVAPRAVTGLRRVLGKDFRRRLSGVELTRGSGAAQKVSGGGVTYRANLPPTHELKVSFVPEGAPDGDITGRTWPVGVHQGSYRVGSTIAE